MSTNKTTNYQLHSWLPSDEFHVAEINENFAALDAALKAEAIAQTALINQKPGLLAGSYIGNGSSIRVELGKRPAAVLVEFSGGHRSAGAYVYGGLAVGEKGVSDLVTIDTTGFSVQHNGVDVSPNRYGSTYYYLALFQ